MIIYVELIWLLNWLIDWMILLLTQSINLTSSKWYRIGFAGFFGSIIVPITILFPDLSLGAWYIKIIHSFVIVYLAFGFHNLAVFLKRLFSFYFMTFAIGGGLLAAHYMFTYDITQLNVELEPTQIHVVFVGVGFPIIFLFTKWRMDKHKYYQFKKDHLYEVSVCWREKTSNVKGYMDSGNQLVEPISQLPVIIGDEYLMQTWFDKQSFKELKDSFQQFKDGEAEEFPYPFFRIIPFKGVGGQSEWLLAFKPDYIQIHMNKQNPLLIEDVLIGIQFGRLVGDNSYQCLLHPRLFKKAG
ncbi:sigma-E processing peptidase SpoIIGA [Gracilibacillus dipsosauri]|uniref:Sporulation sigma-E factor-processing peptidase n=1 Tax=Gracilibacillus dipsosauri TaxID=178340 RepID=A0A317L0B8_9BACI|nr:sigma-E processing peptidase SpoIIGA [Gracilibacillus dipsosauri]PWU68946.1 sigma-E processing peptidase SpoIIGA [Gracilibacillus dipsosauri]